MKKWTQEEKNIIIEMLKNGIDYKQISDKFNRTSKSIKMFAHKNGYKSSSYILRKKNIIVCLQCKLSFERKHKNQKYCSHMCANKAISTARKKHNLCKYCSQTCKKIFCNHECQHNFYMIKAIKEKTASAIVLKRYYLSIKRECSICNNSTWNNQPIPLELDHIDGNHENNILENTRLLCCNCHALTSNYKAKNIGNGRHKRRIRYKEGKSY